MRILVVDDHPFVVEWLAQYLEQIGPEISAEPISVRSVFTLSDAIAAVDAADHPDLVFLDLTLDRDNQASETLKRFQQGNTRKIPVVVFTGLSLSDPRTADILRHCLNDLGAQTILMKDTDLDKMYKGLPRILAGERWLSNELIDLLLKPSTAHPPLELTPRQLDVARAVARGLNNKEIARELNLSEGNVRQIISAIYKRLGINSRMKLGLAVKAADSDPDGTP